MVKHWWMESVGYQIYPKSFYDGNDDGIGDIKGIIEKLDYLEKLGVNLLWICPFYDSPMDDNGYDVRDFFKVAEQFGHMDDVDFLIKEAHAKGIKIVLDFVLNHTSDEHPWFLESKKSKDNPYRDYYIWHDGRVVDGKKIEPTNWGSFFGGSAWQYESETDSYYMKIFSKKMPDLNWKNPKVQEEMVVVAKTWLDKGIDGFRIDAVSHLDRAEFIDAVSHNDEPYPLDWFKFSNLPKVHTYLKMLNNEVFKSSDCLTIGEVGGSASIEEGIKYSAFDQNELSMVFNFDHNWCNNLHDIDNLKKLKTDVICLKKAFTSWQDSFKEIGWIPINWLNHDQPRLMSQYGDYKYPLKSGKMLATLRYMMRGTPFIYQGEEIGMTNYPFSSPNEFNDVSSISSYIYHLTKDPEDPNKALKKVAKTSRDNPRTAMQWSNDFNAGFSSVLTKVLINPNYKKINVQKNLDDKNSLFYHYQKLINLRKDSIYHDMITWGSYELLDPDDQNIYAYLRRYQNDTLLVINSFSRKKQSYSLKNYEILDTLITNEKNTMIKENTLTLRPYESIVFKVKENL